MVSSRTNRPVTHSGGMWRNAVTNPTNCVRTTEGLLFPDVSSLMKWWCEAEWLTACEWRHCRAEESHWPMPSTIRMQEGDEQMRNVKYKPSSISFNRHKRVSHASSTIRLFTRHTARGPMPRICLKRVLGPHPLYRYSAAAHEPDLTGGALCFCWGEKAICFSQSRARSRKISLTLRK